MNGTEHDSNEAGKVKDVVKALKKLMRFTNTFGYGHTLKVSLGVSRYINLEYLIAR